MSFDQDNIRVTVDITGMYFALDVKVPKSATVFDVMTQAKNDTAASKRFPKLDFEIDNKQQFLSRISVLHGCHSAVSRQDPRRTRPDGLYSFEDELGTAQPLLVWQYYITDKNGLLKNGQQGGERRIIPFTEQNHLADGDVIVWRLVGIFTEPTGQIESKAPAGVKAEIASLKSE
jgi:hypothetical protein